MKKTLMCTEMAAAGLLTIGAVAWRFDSLWGEIAGYFGLLLAMICVAAIFAAKAIAELERGKEQCRKQSR